MRTKLFGFLAAALVSMTALPLTAAPFTTVTTLDRGEPFEGMAFHDGILWVGKSRKDFNSDYSLEMYQNDKLIGKVTFPHAATFVHPYAADSVIVVGTGYSPNLTQYTIVKRQGSSFTVNTTQIPINAWARQWIGSHNGKEFFTDPGGNQDDPARDADLSLASQTFFNMSKGSRPRYLTARMRLPLNGVKVGNDFYVINAESIGSPRSNLYRLNPQTGSVAPLFPSYRAALANIRTVPGTSLIALSEEDARQVLLVNAQSGALVGAASELEIEPRALAVMGKCAITGSQLERKLSVIDIKDPAAPFQTMSLTVDLPESEFRQLSHMVADPVNGKVYLRSNFACNPMIDPCTSDWNRIVVLAGEEAAKLAAICR
jgi:hypothetical protein